MIGVHFMKVKTTHKQDAANNSNSTYPKWHFNHHLACKGDIRNIASLPGCQSRIFIIEKPLYKDCILVYKN